MKPIIYKVLLINLLLVFSGFIFGQCSFEQPYIGETCDNAYFICGSELNGYTATLRDSNQIDNVWPDGNTGVCGLAGTFDNTYWMAFAVCANRVVLRIDFSNCQHPLGPVSTGLQAGLYTSCRKISSVDCYNTSGMPSGSFTLSYDFFIPGQLAYLVLDGFDKSICDFRITVIEGIDTTPVTPPNPDDLNKGFITGQNEIQCTDKDIPFNYNLTEPELSIVHAANCNPQSSNPADTVCYVWHISPSTGAYFNNNDSIGTSAEIIYTMPGEYTISVSPYLHPFYGGSCSNAAIGSIDTWQVRVLDKDTIFLPNAFICPGESITFCDQQITQAGTYLCDTNVCNVQIQTFVTDVLDTQQMGTFYVCSGDVYVFQGTSYPIGNHTAVDTLDCRKAYAFNVEALSFLPLINSQQTVLDCRTNSISLSASYTGFIGTSSISYTWLYNGTPINQSTTIDVSQAGIYTLEASVNINGKPCTQFTQITIYQDNDKPEIQVFKPKIDCATIKRAQPPILTVISSDPIASAVWSRPNGTQYTGMNIPLDSLNVVSPLGYTLRIEGANGCITDTVIIVESDFVKPNVSLQGEDISCYVPRALLSVSTNVTWDSIRWSGGPKKGDSFLGVNQTQLFVDKENVYFADVRSSDNKCWNHNEIYIKDEKTDPQISLGPDLKWYCNTTEISLSNLVPKNDPNAQYQWQIMQGQSQNLLTDEIITLLSPGLIIAELFNLDNGCGTSDTIEIVREENIPTDLRFIHDDILCYGQNNGYLDLRGTEGGFEPLVYTLNGSTISEGELTNLAAGEYILEVMDKNGCLLTEVFTIEEPQILTIDTDQEITLAFNELRNLTVQVNYPDQDIQSITWYDALGNILGYGDELPVQLTEDQILTIEVININGCIAETRIKIDIDNDLKAVFPNIFSPNGDGVNDIFLLSKNKIPGTLDQLAIYDRYGNQVYQVKNYDFDTHANAWDGRFNGRFVEAGVYVVIAQFTDYAGKSILVKKDVTILR